VTLDHRQYELLHRVQRVPYRSTEVFKKFPADIVLLRDLLLPPFDFSGMEITVTCYFANMTRQWRPYPAPIK
jgi:hypothetical protein